MSFATLRLRSCFIGGVAILMLSGCQGGTTPQTPAPSPLVATVSCPEILSARRAVGEAFTAAVHTAGDEYLNAKNQAERELKACLAPLWKGGSCDAAAAERQKAYDAAQSDISNEAAYQTYKAAKAKWDDCYAHITEHNADFEQQNQAAERVCQEKFQAEVNLADAAYQGAVALAKAQRDADSAFLSDLEKQCQEKPIAPPTDGPGTPPSISTPRTPPGVSTPPPVIQDAPVICEPVPGENASPRTGRAPDFGPQDIIVNLITTVAEDVTKGPVPTGIISDQIFAGIVVVKIRTRITQLTREMADALAEGRNNRANFLERKIKRYEAALSIWGKIAEGRPPADLQKRVTELQNSEATVFCPPPAMQVDTTVGEIQIHYGR